MSTLSEKSRNNLKIIKHLKNESILSSSSSRDITIQEEFIEVDNINNLENGLYFTFHQCLSDMVDMDFLEKDTLISDIDECIQNIYDNEKLNSLMEDESELYKIMNDIKIIAEIGANHNGDMTLAKEMISAAKESGCDFAKFQSWKESNLRKGVWDSPEPFFQYENKRDFYKKAQLTDDNHYELIEYSNKVLFPSLAIVLSSPNLFDFPPASITPKILFSDIKLNISHL